MPERHDVLVIGSGAGGGAVAHTLAPTGKRILIPERREFLPRDIAVHLAHRSTHDREADLLHCRAHEVDNLVVADTSSFPSIGAVNPALTAVADAIRVGDHIAGRIA